MPYRKFFIPGALAGLLFISMEFLNPNWMWVGLLVATIVYLVGVGWFAGKK